MDVSRPGTSASHPTSRPVIVTNRPVLKDPMVVEEAAESKDETTKVSVTSSKIKIEPLHDDVKPEPADDTVPDEALTDAPVLPVEEVEKPETDEAEQAATELEAPSEPEQPEKPVETEPEPVEAAGASDSLPDDTTDDAGDSTTKDEADHDAQLADLGKPDPEAVKAAREAAEKQLALDKLVAEETYFLPIDRSGKRRMQRTLLVVGLVLFVLLALVAVDLLLDAGLISLGGIEAPTDFIYNK